MSDLITEFPHDDKHQGQRSNNTSHSISKPRQEKASQGFFTFARIRIFGMPGTLLALLLLAAAPAFGWENWGGDRGGTRFSLLTQITPANVGNLVRAWEFRTGDLDARAPAVMERTKFEATPLFVEDSLVFCSPFNEVVALDPGTGAQKWRYDPEISTASAPPTVSTAAASPIGSTTRRPRRRLPRPDFHGHQRCPGHRPRRQDGGPLRRFRRERRSQARDRQDAGLAGRIPDHLGTGREPWRGHRRLLHRGQCPRRRAARDGARLRCEHRAVALELGSAGP